MCVSACVCAHVWAFLGPPLPCWGPSHLRSALPHLKLLDSGQQREGDVCVSLDCPLSL